jgi:GT2 family glycosyltransferase
VVAAALSTPPREVVVAIVTYDSAAHIGGCLDSLASAALDPGTTSITVVDNASTDGTVELVRSRFPQVDLIVNERNLGFGGASNVAIRAALARGAERIFLLNPDTVVDPRFLAEALAVASRPGRIGAVQSLVLLAPDGERVDSAGNELHFLGHGYCRGHGRPRAQAPAEPCEVPFASGAAVLLDGAALRDVGLFDETLFLYGEDLDLGWRLRRAGYSILLAPKSIVLHDHVFARHADKYYLLERNRWLVLLRNWSVRSLVVLAVPLLSAELGLCFVAWRHGWLGAKLRAAGTLFRAEAWSGIRRARRAFAGARRVADRVVAREMTSRLEVDGHEDAFLRYVANPAMALAWKLARALL